MTRAFIPLLLTALALTACGSDKEVSDQPRMGGISGPGYTIDVVRQPDGTLHAVPPECVKWTDQGFGRQGNKPLPQLGCATSGNLARQIADPADLVRDQMPQQAEKSSSVESLAAGVRRYNQGQSYAPGSAQSQ